MNCTPPTFRRVPALLAMCAWCGMLTIAPISLAETPPVAAVPSESAPQSAPAAAPDEDLAESSPSVLSPRFQVGQHAVIKQTLRESRKGNHLVSHLVDVNVIDKINDTFVIRWQMRPFDVPDGTDPAKRAAMEAAVLPPIDILFEEGVGVAGIRHWQATRDKFLDVAEKLSLATPQRDGTPADPAEIAKVIEIMRSTLMNTREGAESILLKRIRGYFDGGYHELTPGDPHEQEVELPFPVGRSGVLVPMTQTTLIEAPTSEPATQYTCVVELRVDRGNAANAIREIVTALANDLGDPANVSDDERAEFDRMLNEASIEQTFRWTLDVTRGWPASASSHYKVHVLDETITDEMTWTLVDGPTMKAVENLTEAPKTDIAPTQLDTP